MAFPKKTWKNRISDEPSRRLLTPTNGGDAYTVDVTRAEGTITQEGDAFNAANMNDLENRIEAAIGGGTDLLAPTEATSTASKPYSVNEYVIYDNKYYRVTAAISQGGSLVPGTNIAEDPVGTALTRIIGVDNTQNTNITNLRNQLRSAGTSGTNFYFDYKNGKYGWNSSAGRGADTFHPFSDWQGGTLYAVNGGYAEVSGSHKGSTGASLSLAAGEYLVLLAFTGYEEHAEDDIRTQLYDGTDGGNYSWNISLSGGTYTNALGNSALYVKMTTSGTLDVSVSGGGGSLHYSSVNARAIKL